MAIKKKWHPEHNHPWRQRVRDTVAKKARQQKHEAQQRAWEPRPGFTRR